MFLLLQVKAYRVLTQKDITGVKTLQGEFNRAELAQLVNSPSRNQLVLKAFLKHATTITTLKDDAAAADNLSSISSSSSINSGSSGMENSGKASGGVEGSMEEDEEQQRQWRQALQGRVTVHCKTVAFAVDIAHAEALTYYFLEAGEGVGWGRWRRKGGG